MNFSGCSDSETCLLLLTYFLDLATGNVPGTPQRVISTTGLKTTVVSSVLIPGAPALKRNTAKIQLTANASFFNGSDSISVVVTRNKGRLEQATESRKEGVAGKMMPLPLESKTSDFRKFSNVNDDLERPAATVHPETDGLKAAELCGVANANPSPALKRSSGGVPEAEMIVKENRCIVSGRLGMNLKLESLASHGHDSSMYAILSSVVFSSFNWNSFWLLFLLILCNLCACVPYRLVLFWYEECLPCCCG